VRIIVIGSGFGGICVAIKLMQAGFDEITLLERADDLGGVWRDNTYPGAACDVPAAFYSYSFATDHEWKSRYAKQPEILDYINKCATDFGVRKQIRFGCEVSNASFDNDEKIWSVTLTNGEKLETDILISAVGLFNRAKLPEIDGRDDFSGNAFHSSNWNHNVDLNGGRVAVIGTGASAIQLVPAIAGQVENLQVFQSSSQYVFPKHDPLLSAPGNNLHSRLARSRARLKDFLDFEITIPRRSSQKWTRRTQNAFLDYLAEVVPDPILRKKLVPRFKFGCKRVLISNDWYPVLQRENVQLINHRVSRIESDGVVGEDGELYPVDTIIYSTGFTPADYLAPMTLCNGNGQTLQDVWQSGAAAYLGMAVPEFSNFFMLYGPNTNVAGSIIFMLECQSKYIVRSLKTLQQRGAKTMQVSETALARYDQAVQRRMNATLLVEPDCHSYYKNADGRVVTQWPGFMTSYRRLTSKVRQNDYIYEKDQGT
jgi:cation diffusion facilitator CzcD-associated flavoprotein CzcO